MTSSLQNTFQSPFDVPADIGDCPLHQRPNECFCTNCNVIICPSCLMFDSHKGHSVCEIEAAAQEIRKQMDEAAKIGLFKLENTENVLLEIRHTKLTVEEAKQKILLEVEQIFKIVIKQLKARREEVRKEIEEHFNKETDRLTNFEEKWTNKQELCLELINFLKWNDDIKILLNARRISNSIQELSEALNYEKIHLISSLNSSLPLVKEKGVSQEVSLKELLKGLQKFVRMGEAINMQYRC